ncbi:MAG: acyl-CoA dehydrogenase family protein [Dehalococcoidia bacterium]|nr:acyl-CoA dehydrogenase family protein [Dehalococcoidia bacterium]
MDSAATAELGQLVARVRRFVAEEVLPVASAFEKRDEYPTHLVQRMRELGLFAMTIPREYGGLGINTTTYATVVEELCRGWMSLSGMLHSPGCTHLLIHYGTEDQKRRWLPRMAAGEIIGVLALTEPNAGSDVQALQATAVRHGDSYTMNGTKQFITNAVHGGLFATLVKTDTAARPPYRGISCFMLEKDTPGFTVGRSLQKLGYKGVSTCELHFQDAQVAVKNLLGDKEGEGFLQLMSGLELSRIHVSARALGEAQAALEAALRFASQRQAFGKPIAQHQAILVKLADMATRLQAARYLVSAAAAKKDMGERCDLEAGMAKLFATEACAEIAIESMRIHGGRGYLTEYPVERFYRDAPFMVIADGTSDVLKLVIARNLYKKYPV